MRRDTGNLAEPPRDVLHRRQVEFMQMTMCGVRRKRKKKKNNNEGTRTQGRDLPHRTDESVRNCGHVLFIRSGFTKISELYSYIYSNEIKENVFKVYVSKGIVNENSHDYKSYS